MRRRARWTATGTARPTAAAPWIARRSSRCSTSPTPRFRPAGTRTPSASSAIARRGSSATPRAWSAFSWRSSRARRGPRTRRRRRPRCGRSRPGIVGACRALDETLEAMKPVRELRQASRQMGRQTLRVAALLTGGRASRRLSGGGQRGPGARPSRGRLRHGRGRPRLAPRRTRRPPFCTRPPRCSSAPRCGSCRWARPEGQRILWRLHPVIARVAREAAARDPAEMWSFAPGLDVQGMLHARLETRLFRS